jgi:hypothetical protein
MASRFPFLAGLSRVWFPLALIVLLLLAIPGAVLLAMTLLNQQGETNRWLEDHYRLSYHLPVPWWAGLLLLLMPLAILLLYFLKLKRKPLRVPSTFLWRKSIEDLHVNSLFQWLRDNVLLLLQILTVLFLIYAVMAFQFHASAGQGKHYILLLDNSASMSATDVAPNRLAQAQQAALNIIDSHNDDDFGMVIVFNSSAEIKQSYTNNREVLRQEVRNVRPTNRPTRIDEALSLASSLANPTRSTEDEASKPAQGVQPGQGRTYVTAEGIPTEVHIFSDGRFPDVPEFSQGKLDLHLHLLGVEGKENADNVAITQLNATRDEKDPTKVQVLVGVRNYRPKPAHVKVSLEVIKNGRRDGTIIPAVAQPQGEEVADPKTAVIPARTVTALPAKEGEKSPGLLDRPGEGLAIFEVPDLDERDRVTLLASLEGNHDKFALDDQAWLVVGVVRKARVLIVGTPNRVLHAFFDHPATQKVAEVTYLAPEDLSSGEKYRKPARAGSFDLVIFDRCAPEKEEDLPLANTFFIGDVPPPWQKDKLPKLKNPHVKGWLSKNPLLRYLVALYDIGIDEAFAFDLKDPRVPPRTPRLLETDRDAAVMFALNRQSFVDLVMTFALLDDRGGWNSNWPLQPSFPLFLRNVLYTLGNVSDAAGEETLQAGQLKLIRPDAAVTEVTVTSPAEKTDRLLRSPRGDFSYSKTDELGVYQARWQGGGRDFAVNLLDADESNIEPRQPQQIQIGNAELVRGEKRDVPRETWKWVALGALVLLLLEWYVYNRRIFV